MDPGSSEGQACRVVGLSQSVTPYRPYPSPGSERDRLSGAFHEQWFQEAVQELE